MQQKNLLLKMLIRYAVPPNIMQQIPIKCYFCLNKTFCTLNQASNKLAQVITLLGFIWEVFSVYLRWDT